MPKRILFTSHTAGWTGPTNSLLLLLERLREAFDVAVAVPGDGPFVKIARESGLEVVRFPTLTKWALPALTRHVRAAKYDVVYGNNTRSSSRISFLAARMAGVPFVCHVRGMEWRAGWRDLWYLRHAAAVIAVSEACARSVARFVPEARLHVVHNGVPLAEDGQAAEPRVREEVRQALGIEPGALLLLSVSHVCERKAQHLAVEALAGTREALPNARLVVAGALDREPGYTDQCKGRIRQLGLDDKVRLLGFRSDVDRLYRAADILVHTALADPHPRAVIEGMAVGLPVIAFATDGVAESVVDRETGRLVPTGDVHAMGAALVEIARDGEARRRMGAAGRQRARTSFSADATAEGVRNILESLWTEQHAAA